MDLARNLKSETVSRLYPTQPWLVQATQPVADAVKLMREKKVGCGARVRPMALSLPVLPRAIPAVSATAAVAVRLKWLGVPDLPRPRSTRAEAGAHLDAFPSAVSPAGAPRHLADAEAASSLGCCRTSDGRLAASPGKMTGWRTSRWTSLKRQRERAANDHVRTNLSYPNGRSRPGWRRSG